MNMSVLEEADMIKGKCLSMPSMLVNHSVLTSHKSNRLFNYQTPLELVTV